MTWSLGLTASGDLALSGNSLAKVSNAEKLKQDLKCEFLEEKGTNKFYLNYGSNIDSQVIGETYTNFDQIAMLIEAEIGDVIRRHQSRQLSRAKSDAMQYGKATLTKNEVVVDFRIAKLYQEINAVYIEIDLITASSNPSIYPVKLTLTV